MTQASVATDLHEALHVLLNIATQVALDVEVLLDVVAQLDELLLGQIVGAGVGVDTGVGQNLLRGGQADAVNVGQGDLDALIARKIDTNKTCHAYNPFLPSPDAACGGGSRR